ncbi:uncharacterized protein LOC131992639 [Centropristis striata]|uniref:uncharacterized protein LOC131992639 n=1 Tax=Centropristis striata TaxID=184440 RepID=UPI0027E17E25|nr:uncharacterized protein LOC131992639 [Centropristis striata]
MWRNKKKVCIMSESVQTSPDSLCKLVRWAHSHGTICSLIPNLQHLACVSPETPGPHGNSVGVAAWSCGAGHAYHWPLSDDNNNINNNISANSSQDRFVGRSPANKVTVRASCDLSGSEAASEAEEFTSRMFDGCDSSATDEDGDYEPRPSRKRGGASGGGGASGKKIKQEETSAEDYNNSAANTETDAVFISTNTHTQITHTHTHGAAEEPKTELIGAGAGSCVTGTIDQAERCSSATETTEKTAGLGQQEELEKLQALLCAERSRTQQMAEMISSLKQDKELLQHEVTKKAELICDFLQDKLRPEKRWPCSSNQMEAGSSHMASSDDVGGFDTPTLFDSFEEVELHLLDRHRSLKTKRNRDGENPRVRMKNVVGVIARYMAALQEFRRSVSMKVAFDRVGVDRNTISRTAAIAELSLAAPEVFHGLAPWDEKEETLAHYSHRCKQAMDDNIRAKIKTMKAKGELLPIVSK